MFVIGHFIFLFSPPLSSLLTHMLRHPTAWNDLFLLETLGQGHLKSFLAVFVRLEDHYLPFNAKHRKSVSIIFGLLAHWPALFSELRFIISGAKNHSTV